MKINDAERAMWIDNDEGLYGLWKRSRQSKRKFIRENRQVIDEVIHNVIEGAKRPYYLMYG